MRHLHWAELRESWSAWLGVSIGFIVVNFSLALAALATVAGVVAVRSGQVPVLQSAGLVINPAQNIVFCAVIGAAVIATSTSLVVNSRRGSLARIALSGATPRQVVSTVMTQLVVLSLVCSVVGDAVAYLLLPSTLHFLAFERGEGMPTPVAVNAVWPVLLANLIAVGVAILGGYQQARRASRIAPVEALRQSAGGQDPSMSRPRWVGVGLCVLVIAGGYGSIPIVTADPDQETISNLFQTSLVLIIVAAALIALVAPVIVRPLTRAWTRLIPSFDPSWDLARSTAIARADRLTRSVVPVTMTIGLMFGVLALADTLKSSLTANGFDVELSSAGAPTLLVFLGMPLLIALSGGVGSLIMMSKQRDAELALSGIVGTTPAQRVGMPVMEGVIIAVTGALLSLVMVIVPVVFLAVGFPAAHFDFAFSPSFAAFGLAFGVALMITVAATVLPTLRSLRQPEPRVIARLVAE